MPYNTGNPVGSEDPRDLSDNAVGLDRAVADTSSNVWFDRLGRQRKTLSGIEREAQAILSSIGYSVAVPYAQGINITSPRQTVIYNGTRYAANPASIPFVTGASFDPSKFVELDPEVDVVDIAASVDPTFDNAVGNGTADDTAAVLLSAARGKGISINRPTRVSGTTNLGLVRFGPNGRLVVWSGSTVTLTIDGDPLGQQIFDTSNGGVIKLAQNWARPDWWGDIERSVIIAALALPDEGGKVLLLNRRYKPQRTVFNGYQLVKENISLIGTGTPRYNADCTAIEGGSVIEGRFNVFADSFHHENIGYDFGKVVCDKYYSTYDTHSVNHPDGYTWDAFAFAVPNGNAGTRPRRGYSAKNILGLLRDPFSVGHAILQEGIVHGDIENVHGCGGVHAFVIKSLFINARGCGGYGSSENQIILKADSYAECRSVKFTDFATDFYPPGCTGWWGQVPSRNGLHLQAAAGNLGDVKPEGGTIRGARRSLYTSSGAGFFIDGLQMGKMTYDGFGVSDDVDYTGQFTKTVGMLFEAEKHARMQLGRAIVNNVTDVLAATQYEPLGSEEFSFESIKATNWSGMMVAANVQARIKIDELHGTNGNNVYYEESTSRILVGREFFVGVTGGKFNTTAGSGIPTTGIILQPGWTSGTGNNPPFVLKKENFGMVAVGSLERASGAGVTMGLIPSFLRPQKDDRMAIALQPNGVSFQPAVLVVAPGGMFNIDSAMPSDTIVVMFGHSRWDVV